MAPWRSRPIAWAMRVTCGNAARNSGARFIAIAGCCNKWCDHIAIAVAESDDLIAFHFLMAAEPNVVATFLRRGCRPITMNDGRVEQICLMKGRYRIDRKSTRLN